MHPDLGKLQVTAGWLEGTEEGSELSQDLRLGPQGSPGASQLAFWTFMLDFLLY